MAPKNSKIQGEVNAKVDELLKMRFIEHSKSPYSSPIVMVKKEDGQVETVCRLQTDQREVSEGCLPNAPHKLHPRSNKGSAVHQQFGPEGWILADPTGKK